MLRPATLRRVSSTAALKRFTAALALVAALFVALPARATVWALQDYFPNFDSADTCALRRGSGINPGNWYAIAEPLSTCIGATSGTCWRRGQNPSRAQGSPGSGYGWDYQTWSANGKAYYFGLIIYRANEIEVLAMDNPESHEFMPATVDDTSSNPLWATIYYNSGRVDHYDNSWHFLSSSTFAEYAQIVIDKVDDPAYGAPYVALRVSAWSGPTATGPWTLGERVWLRNTMADRDTDTTNCDGSAAYRGMYQWMTGDTLLFRNVDGWQYHP
jgi:hypothetical protein